VAELKQPVRPPDAEQPALHVPAAARRRPVVAWLGLVAVIVGAVLGSNVFSVRDQLFGSAIPEPAAPVASRDAFSAVRPTAHAPTKLRSQPWFQDITTLSGTGPAGTRQFTIVDDAIQWRLGASCDSGRLVVRAPGRPEPILDTACPPSGTGYANGAGTMRLDVQADGPWRLRVAQQIDAPLVEPPLRAMTAPGATKLATGSFYKVDKTGKGTVTIYRQADGRYSLRLERFFVTPTADLEVRLSPRKAPRTSRDYTSAPSKLVAKMDVTAGSLNFVVPAGVDPTQFGSVVIWCAATASAYAAASLRTNP